MSEKNSKIIALDFDGCIVTNKYPEIGKPIEKNIKKIKEEIANGARVILWTNRVDEYLDAAVNFCNDHDIRLEAVNENLPEIITEFGGSNTRKIFANEYWDDRAVWMSEYDSLSKTPTAELVMELQKRPANGFHHVLQMQDVGNFSDGYHTFNDLYAQRRSLSITLFNTYRHQSWKSRKHSDGQFCFGGGWFIVGIDTPAGQYTYHYEDMYWNNFECKELDMAPEWDGHTDKDVIRLETLSTHNFWIPVAERLPEAPYYDWVLVKCQMMPEAWYGVPHIAELRNGIWYGQNLGDRPLEETLSIKITHWCPLPGDLVNQEVIK